jgi:3-oxoacyl-[acyl-carrier protein] reductase
MAGWGWPVTIVYLDDQPRADAAVAEIIAAGGTTVAVRADLADDLDVQRLFIESIAAFGGVDVVVHTTTDDVACLYLHAARYVRHRGAVFSTYWSGTVAPQVEAQFHERRVTVGRAPPEAVLDRLDRWRQRNLC